MARAAKSKDLSEDDAQELSVPEVDVQALVAAEIENLSKMSLEEVLRAGHEDLLRLLVAKVRSGTASHQEQAILRNILRDNGMTLGVSPYKTIEGSPAPNIDDLPQLEPPDYS